MNERIKEMSKQAHLVADATYAEGPDSVWLKEYNKKFAELIVRECGELVKARLTHIPDNQDDWDGHNYGETAAVYGILDAFQEHLGVDCDQKYSKFGVEE